MIEEFSRPTDDVASEYARPDIAALLWIWDSPENWGEAIVTCQKVTGVESVVISGAGAPEIGKGFKSERVSVDPSLSLAGSIQKLVAEGFDQILLVTAPIAAAPGLLDVAQAWIARDFRVSTVSFLSNAAGYLSFPFRNTAFPHSLEGHNEKTILTQLRSLKPRLGPIPIAVPEGAAVLLGRNALVASGGFDTNFDDDAHASVVEFALRSARRGFTSYVDVHSYLSRPLQLSAYSSACADEYRRNRLNQRHPSFPSLHDEQMHSKADPLAIGLSIARTKIFGLRIFVDATCLGPLEMGTQVQTLALIKALAEHPRVKSVAVGMPGIDVPTYARDVLAHPKVTRHASEEGQFPTAPDVDIFHRPFQPDTAIPWDRWHQIGQRVVLTILDLIAYRNGAYHHPPHRWLEYRNNMRESVWHSDAVVSISHDVVDVIREEKLRIPDERIFVCELGTDHLDSGLAEAIPVGFSERGWTSATFLACLGAGYAHKNRDLAIRVWKEVTRRGRPIKLVLAGVQVAYGSARVEEAMSGVFDDDVLSLPDLSAQNRNWLLRHAAAVLYPTSAEGFGLVPFEAARMGTPTLYVAFGPLKEMLSPAEQVPTGWDEKSLADHLERFLNDPQASSAAVASALRAGQRYSWSRTADRLVAAYFDTLARPPR